MTNLKNESLSVVLGCWAGGGGGRGALIHIGHKAGSAREGSISWGGEREGGTIHGISLYCISYLPHSISMKVSEQMSQVPFNSYQKPQHIFNMNITKPEGRG